MAAAAQGIGNHDVVADPNILIAAERVGSLAGTGGKQPMSNRDDLMCAVFAERAFNVGQTFRRVMVSNQVGEQAGMEGQLRSHGLRESRNGSTREFYRRLPASLKV